MSMLATFKTDLLPILKQGSDREIDPSLINDMELWSDPPKAIEILYSLDINAYFALSSGFISQVLTTLYNTALHEEGVTEAEIEKRAAELWRDANLHAEGKRPNF